MVLLVEADEGPLEAGDGDAAHEGDVGVDVVVRRVRVVEVLEAGDVDDDGALLERGDLGRALEDGRAKERTNGQMDKQTNARMSEYMNKRTNQ